MTKCDFYTDRGFLEPERYRCDSPNHPKCGKNLYGKPSSRCLSDFKHCPHYYNPNLKMSKLDICPFCEKPLEKYSIINGRCGECGKYI